MNLYYLLFDFPEAIEDHSKILYVVANSMIEAMTDAKNLMGNLYGKVETRIDKIELIASVNTYRAKELLFIHRSEEA